MHDGHALGGCLATVHEFSIDARMSDGLDVANYSVWEQDRGRKGRGSRFGESKSVQVIALYSLRNVTCHVTSFGKVSRVLKELDASC